MGEPVRLKYPSIKLHHLRLYDLIYLATPYSKYPAGIDAAFKDAANLAGRLLKNGLRVYSPIAHTHPLAMHADINPLDHSIWIPFDESMMRACQSLLVAHMDGWNESVGIKHEIEFFERAGKTIHYINPNSLEIIQ